MAGPWVGALIVLCCLGGLFGGLRLYQRWAKPHPELVRKLLHVGMGVVTLTFPWLFESPWPVVALAALAAVSLGIVRRVPQLRAGFGQVVCGVERATWGEIYFPVAVALVFVLARHENVPPERQALLYVIPVLLLTLADALAALIGVRYGTLRYPTEDGVKSLEGSLAFFLVAFFCVHIPILLTATDIGRTETLLIALLMALLGMLFEAIAWRGLDNLLLPLFGFYLLRLYLGMDEAALLARLAVMIGLIAFALLYRHFTTLAGSGVLVAALFGYAAWTLGGWLWLTPPLVMFLAYGFLSPPTPRTNRPVHNVHAVLCVVAAGLLWLFLNKSLDSPALLAPYVAGFAAHLGLTAVARFKHDFPHWKAARLLTVCVLEGWLIIVAPFVVVAGFSTFALAVAAAALVGTAVAVVGFYCCQPRIEDCPLDTPRWVRQGTCGAVGSLAGLAACWAA